MTKANAKKWYDFYVQSGNKAAAENMLAKYPEFDKKESEKKKKEEE